MRFEPEILAIRSRI